MVLCLVVYDIPDDAARAKVADACLDYGLQRIQYSAFLGEISPNHQEELLMKIKRRVGTRAANVQLFPICDRDLRQRRVFEQKPGSPSSEPPARPRRARRHATRAP